jgi:polysaccharide biosynthesis/export protein
MQEGDKPFFLYYRFNLEVCMFKSIISTITIVSILLVNTVFAADTYKIKEGDSLQISVWGEETLHKEVKVLPDGSISFPLAGRIDVVDATAAEVEKRVTEKLKTYLPDPQVTVAVSNIDGNRVFVLGKVLKPGPVLMTGPMTVMQALSLAGGLDKFAEQGSIKVLRGQSLMMVDYNALMRGQNLTSNVMLKTGDTILVP